MPIQTKNLSFNYTLGDKSVVYALKNVNININDGEFVGVMGKTGCGKTTFAQLLAGLIKPCEGSVMLDGKDINSVEFDRSILRAELGIVFQYPEYQLFAATVEKDVAFGLKYLSLNASEIKQRVKDSLELMNFSYEDIRLMSPLALSGGEKRRVAIAGVLAIKPKILIFDEPVAGLDPLGREAFLALIKKLNNDGVTIIMISHNADAIAQLCKRLIVFENGSVVYDASVKEAFCEYNNIPALKLIESSVFKISEKLRKMSFEVPEDTVLYDELTRYLINELKREKQDERS